MKLKISLSIKFLMIFLVILIFLGFWYYGYYEPQGEGDHEYASPDGRHRIVIYNTGLPLPVMPGQGGDGSGLLVLRDQDGRSLRKIRVDRANGFSDSSFIWGDDYVVIVSIGKWPFSPDSSD